MSETGKGEISPQRPPSKIRAVLEKIVGFGRRSETVTPSQAAPIIPSEPTTVTESPEAISTDTGSTTSPPEPDIPEPEQAEEAEPIQPVIENQERQLRPANRIFFHGTRLRNLSEIRSRGLYALKDIDVLGRDLFQSLYMELEYGDIAIGRSPFTREEINLIDELPADQRERIYEGVNKFVLTVWGDSPYIQKTADQRWRHRTGQYGLTKTLETPIATPTGTKRLGGDTLTPEEHAHLPTEDLLVGIPITQYLKDHLIAAQLNFLTNRKTADQIEAELTAFLSEPGNVIIVKEGYTPAELSHDLLSRIQQKVVLFTDGLLVKQGISGANAMRELAWDVSLKLKLVNEPISAEYLRRLQQRLHKTVQQKGLIDYIYSEQGEVKPPILQENFVSSKYLGTNFWGSIPMNDVRRVIQQLGLAQ